MKEKNLIVNYLFIYIFYYIIYEICELKKLKFFKKNVFEILHLNRKIIYFQPNIIIILFSKLFLVPYTDNLTQKNRDIKYIVPYDFKFIY